MLEAHNSAGSPHTGYAATIPAGYAPSGFTGNELAMNDIPAISPHLASPDRPAFLDDAELEALEDATLAEGRTIAELEQQALTDELQAVALEIALSATKDTMNGLLDPTSRLVPCTRLLDGSAPSCTYMRLAFRHGALQSAVRRLQSRAKRLRRAADRLMRDEAKKRLLPSGNVAMVA